MESGNGPEGAAGTRRAEEAGRAEEEGREERREEGREKARHEETRPARRLRVAALLLLGLTACIKTGRNYPDPVEPRYAGTAANIAAPPRGDTLRIVSFNIEYAAETRRAIRILESAPALRDADIVLLQEMTGPKTKMVADSLGMHYVYYPAIYNRIVRHDIGNAVLSRWPIVKDAKLILPSRSRYAKTQRIATAASIQVGSQVVRVYSTHLGTPADLGWEGRVAQLRAIMEDAAVYPLAIIGGDMNSKDLGKVAREAGYLWPTDTIPKSNLAGRIDHFFVRGFAVLDSAGAGTSRVPSTISDHSAIWIAVTRPKR